MLFLLLQDSYSAFSRLPVRGPRSQALLSLTMVCTQSKGLSLGGESSGA